MLVRVDVVYYIVFRLLRPQGQVEHVTERINKENFHGTVL